MVVQNVIFLVDDFSWGSLIIYLATTEPRMKGPLSLRKSYILLGSLTPALGRLLIMLYGPLYSMRPTYNHSNKPERSWWSSEVEVRQVFTILNGLEILLKPRLRNHLPQPLQSRQIHLGNPCCDWPFRTSLLPDILIAWHLSIGLHGSC